MAIIMCLKLREKEKNTNKKKRTRPITHRVNIVLIVNGEISTPEISNRS